MAIEVPTLKCGQYKLADGIADTPARKWLFFRRCCAIESWKMKYRRCRCNKIVIIGENKQETPDYSATPQESNQIYAAKNEYRRLRPRDTPLVSKPAPIKIPSFKVLEDDEVASAAFWTRESDGSAAADDADELDPFECAPGVLAPTSRPKASSTKSARRSPRQYVSGLFRSKSI